MLQLPFDAAQQFHNMDTYIFVLIEKDNCVITKFIKNCIGGTSFSKGIWNHNTALSFLIRAFYRNANDFLSLYIWPSSNNDM